MEVQITPRQTTAVRLANLPAGQPFAPVDAPVEMRARVYVVLYHPGLASPTICLCFRDGKAPERCELSTDLAVEPYTFTAAAFRPE